jgi:antitoxin component YwqK of YwqJK toxin-antitoxin module
MGADGKMTWWYANGKLESESYYDNNEPTGEWKYWNEDGVLIKTERYEAGKLVETINYER